MRTDRPEKPRILASVLASWQTPDSLLTAMDRDEGEGRVSELLACLLQEMVLRGVNVAAHPAAVRLAERMRATGHPLAILPLTLMDLECEVGVWLPAYDKSRWVGSAEQPSSPPTPARSHADSGPTTSTSIATPRFYHPIAAAVRNWQEESNGRVEARAFEFDRPLTQDEMRVTLLMALNLEALRGATEEQIALRPGDLQEVFGDLFSTASLGGACNLGLSGAYGRLAAWESLAAMAGAPDGASIEEVGSLAQRCTWGFFGAKSEWFCGDMWDFGLVALRPDGRSLAVLAATDRKRMEELLDEELLDEELLYEPDICPL
jgi:Family of unknown function (DUF6183)